MRYAIISDIHGNLEALEAALDDIKSQKCTDIVCLGDIVGYGANPKECLDLIRSLNIPVVKGNHDEYIGSDLDPEGFNDAAAEVVRWTRAQLTPEDREWLRNLPYFLVLAEFSIVHATLDSPQRWGYTFEKLEAAANFANQETAICFFGHTHVPVAFIRDTSVRGGTYTKFRVEPAKKYFVNVGSVGQPRDGNPRAAYVIYDLPARTVELRRLNYDVATAQKKIRAAGLPEKLAERLEIGAIRPSTPSTATATHGLITTLALPNRGLWLLMLLIAAWILPGLIGRDPWKADEAYTYGLVLHMSETGDLVVPELGGEPFMQKPTVFFATATACCKAFSWIAGYTTAAHGANVIFLGLTLAALWFASLELNGKGNGPAAAILLMGSVVYLHTAHLLITDVSLVAGFAIAYYGLALGFRRPVAGGFILGTGAGIAFMSKGLLGPGLLGISIIALMMLFSGWRTWPLFASLGVALAASLPWVLIWPLALLHRDRELFNQWFLDNNMARFLGPERVGRPNNLGLEGARYWFLTALPWYTWPAFPLACLACWKERSKVLKDRAFQLPVVMILVIATILTLSRNGRELYGLPLLIPACVLAARGCAFLHGKGLEIWRQTAFVLFGVPIALAWLVWLGVQLDWPGPLLRKIHDRLPEFEPAFQVGPMLIALAATFLWFLWMLRQQRSLPLNALVNWTAGPVLAYLLAMTLWLPALESNMSYRHLAPLREVLQKSVSPGACVASVNLGEPQRAMFHYYAGLKTERRELNRGADCDWVLIQSEARRIETEKEPGPGLKLVWQSVHSRKELFRLFHRSPPIDR
jgi:4-amino-4-deoxy-L-arabinose transferase-like glycosyltransferase/diadenosine tetraphosphatase ApaH/serine/threonine PP2A family protein phosphatase